MADHRTPCPTCPWRRSVPRRGFPGGIIDARRLVQMVEGGLGEQIMQCHCSRDDKPEVCVGFVLQVGRRSVSCRWAVMVELFDPNKMSTDEPLHTFESILQTHGGRPTCSARSK